MAEATQYCEAIILQLQTSTFKNLHSQSLLHSVSVQMHCDHHVQASQSCTVNAYVTHICPTPLFFHRRMCHLWFGLVSS